MAQIVEVLSKTPTGVLILVVLCCLGGVWGLFQFTLFLAKRLVITTIQEVKELIGSVQESVDGLVPKVDLLNINTTALSNTLTNMFNGEFKKPYEDERLRLKDDAKFLSNNS